VTTGRVDAVVAGAAELFALLGENRCTVAQVFFSLFKVSNGRFDQVDVGSL
jgi:hypothetical protein